MLQGRACPRRRTAVSSLWSALHRFICYIFHLRRRPLDAGHLPPHADVRSILFRGPRRLLHRVREARALCVPSRKHACLVRGISMGRGGEQGGYDSPASSAPARDGNVLGCKISKVREGTWNLVPRPPQRFSVFFLHIGCANDFLSSCPPSCVCVYIYIYMHMCVCVCVCVPV